MTYGNDDFLPVILGTSLNTYNMARSLHEAYGVRSLALGRVALRETADSKIVGVRSYAEFDSPEFIVSTLKALAAEFPGRKRLLIANIEFYVNVLIEHRAELEPDFIIPLVSADLASKLMEKSDFYATCAELGVPHPTTVVLTGNQPVATVTEAELPFRYPVILKPSNTDIYPRLKFAGKKKVYVADDATALATYIDLVRDGGYTDDLIIQDYITGDESVMRVVNTYSDRHGKLVFLSAGQIALADLDPQYLGNYHAVITMEDPALTESIRHFLESMNYVGPANFDVMYDERDGTSKLLELNVRQGAASYYTMAAGGNLTQCYVEDHVYGADLGLHVTSAERLWLNLPYLVALAFAPKAMRPRIRKAAKNGKAHTFYYRPDFSVKRFVDVARLNLRVSQAYLKFGRDRLKG